MGLVHVENRRLFDMATGKLKLAEWEENHLHECGVCQGVLSVFIHQPIPASQEDTKETDAA
jgi:hypothetical protein